MIFIVTSKQHLTNGYPSEPDDVLLLEAFHRRGIPAQGVAWDDQSVDWSVPTVSVIRSTWDYHFRLSDFLSWAERAASHSILCNSVRVVRWNAHKSYLRDLEQRGIPVIPTLWVEPEENIDLQAVMARYSWPAIVVKPVISTNAYATLLITEASTEYGSYQVQKLLRERAIMVQPYVTSVMSEGERSHIWINGYYNHTFRKKAAIGSDQYGEMSVQAQTDEIELSQHILRTAAQCLGFIDQRSFLIARVDLIRDPQGILRLMELELIEPRMRLIDAPPQTANRLVDAILMQMEQPGFFSYPTALAR